MTVEKYKLTQEHGEIDPKYVPWWTSSRFGLAIIGFLGFINVYALRVNLSVAIVCMVNRTAVENITSENVSLIYSLNGAWNSTEGSYADDNGESCQNSGETGDNDLNGEFLWDKPVQGLVLGSFFWGYLVTQIPGGWLATKFGGKKVLGWSMFFSGVATLFTPLAARVSYVFLIILRIVIGLGTGVAFPAMHAMWGRWAPVFERTKLTSFTYAGAQVGNVITFPLSALLCRYGFAGGWPSIFYVIGSVSIVWVIAWMFLVSDSPSEHKRISEIEKRYIMQALKGSVNEHKKLNIPWKHMFTSLPVWAIIVANTTSDWGAYTLLTCIPTYMKDVLKFDITSNGLYSALPYILFWLGINVSGWLADLFRSKGWLSTTLVRKIWDSIGHIFPAVMLVILGYLECSQSALAVTLLVLAVAMSAPIFSGYAVNHVDIAPAYAGILFGISNSIAAITGFISPSITGLLTQNGTRAEWHIVFYIAAAVYIAGAIFYIIFASGDLQPWAFEGVPETANLNLRMDVEMEDMNSADAKPPPYSAVA